MKAKKDTKNDRPSVLDVVALLADLPAQRLARGQVGTIVEQLDDKTLLVEFSDDQGRAYATRLAPGRTCWSCTTSRRRPDTQWARPLTYCVIPG